MAFADPQVWTVNAVDKTMPRTSQGVNLGEFKTSDGVFSLKVQHSYGRRRRSNLRFTWTKIAADPFDTTKNETVSMTLSFSVDTPIQGFTITEQQQLCQSLFDEMTANSSALTTKLLGGES